MIDRVNAEDNLWQEVVNSALLGTSRRPPALPNNDTPLGITLSRLNGSAPERVLLGAASTLPLYRRVGQLAGAATDNGLAPERCPAEDLPMCSPRAADHLSLMLQGKYDQALPEWLAAAVAARCVAPPESLPTLLSARRNSAEAQDALLAVIGKRGRWLAAQNPDWAYAAELGDDEASWGMGDRAIRLLSLERLRARDPARARELVAAAWGQEKASDRTAMLTAFRVGLRMDDEPFLEEQLDDRSKEVRALAASLLAELPESAYVQRMKAGVLPLLDFKKVEQKRLFRSSVDASYIEVSLAQDYTTAMQRDGIERKPPDTKIGEKAYWLQQMLGRIPPDFWVQTWGVESSHIIAVAMSTKEWRSVLVAAWADATRRYKDVAWAEAFLGHTSADLGNSPAQNVLWILPSDRREGFILNILQRKPEALYTEALPLHWLWTLQEPWGAELSRAVLKSLSRHIVPENTYGNWEARQSLRGFSRAMPPAIREEAVSILLERSANNPHFRDAVDDFLSTLEFRQKMLKELAP